VLVYSCDERMNISGPCRFCGLDWGIEVSPRDVSANDGRRRLGCGSARAAFAVLLANWVQVSTRPLDLNMMKVHGDIL